MTMQEKIDAIVEVCDAVGGTLREEYSGRNMYGKTCYGIVTSDATACIEEAGQRGLRGAVRDSMGLDYIVYWPNVSKDKA